MPTILLYDTPGATGEFVCRLAPRAEVPVLATYPARTGDAWRGTYEAGGDGRCVLTVAGKRYYFLYWEAGATTTRALAGERVLLHRATYMAEFEEVLGRMGLSSGELTDMVTSFTVEMEMSASVCLTVLDASYDAVVPLRVDGFDQVHRVVVGIEGLGTKAADELVKRGLVKEIPQLTARARPHGKFVVEWGGLFLNQF